MSVQEKGYLLAGELMPSNLRIRMLYTVMFLSKLLSILVKDCMYRRRILCTGECMYVHEKGCMNRRMYVCKKNSMYRKRIVCTGECMYVHEKGCMYRRMYVCK